MLCCGMLALIAATGLGAWRTLRAHPRTVLTLAGVLLAAVPVVALAAGLSAEARTEAWMSAMRSLCGQPYSPATLPAAPGQAVRGR
jgi:hypothetical protein